MEHRSQVIARMYVLVLVCMQCVKGGFSRPCNTVRTLVVAPGPGTGLQREWEGAWHCSTETEYL